MVSEQHCSERVITTSCGSRGGTELYLVLKLSSFCTKNPTLGKIKFHFFPSGKMHSGLRGELLEKLFTVHFCCP